jgi:hypothetical protein
MTAAARAALVFAAAAAVCVFAGEAQGMVETTGGGSYGGYR